LIIRNIEPAEQHDIYQKEAQRISRDIIRAPLIDRAGAVEVAVEPAEEPASGFTVMLLDGLEQRGAQRRRQNHGNEHRQCHCRDDGNRELSVDSAGGPAEERHRNKDGRQHERDAD
jgi:hypothetical protein